jgi:hypothetical protein
VINKNPRADIGYNPSDSREDTSGLCRISRPADSKRISGYNILHPFIRFLSAGRLATVDQIHRVDIGHNPSDSRGDMSGFSTQLWREDLFLVAEVKSLNTKGTKATKEIHKEKSALIRQLFVV